MEFTNQLVDGKPSKTISERIGLDVQVGTGLRMRSGLKLARNDVIFVGRDRGVCCIVKACSESNTIDFAKLHYSMLIISDYFDHYSYSSDSQNNYFHYITGLSFF